MVAVEFSGSGGAVGLLAALASTRNSFRLLEFPLLGGFFRQSQRDSFPVLVRSTEIRWIWLPAAGVFPASQPFWRGEERGRIANRPVYRSAPATCEVRLHVQSATLWWAVASLPPVEPVARTPP